MGGGDLQPIWVAAGDAHRVAVQVVADDAHLALHNVRVEGFVVLTPRVEKPVS